MSFDVITPLAARRLFESVHWTPAIWWQIDRIEVLNPIRMEWRPTDGGSGAGMPARSLCLIDVRYLLVARFELTAAAAQADNAAQHAAMFQRRLRQQRFFRSPDLGGRSWPASVHAAADGEQYASAYASVESIDLGWMIFDRERDDRERLRFYRPEMRRGVIDLAGIDPKALPS